MDTNDYARNLPDAFRQDSSSNNYKLLLIGKTSQDVLSTDIQDVFDSADLENATGATLDLYGDSVGQARGAASDTQYRYMIKAKITRNLSDGTINGILNALCTTFSCEPDEIELIETDDICTVKLERIPLGAVIHAGFTPAQTAALVGALLPVCISLEVENFSGTFEFDDSEGVYDADKGFTNVEGGTIGGYFGILYSDEAETILPM